MRTEILLKPLAPGHMIGMRSEAMSLRKRVEAAIESGQEVGLDFSGVEATQSFIDELVGALILRMGPEVLDRLIFRNCSQDVRAIVKFVAADRADQFAHVKH